ncbi:DUF3598 family protein [Microcoleus sp. F8-D3]
MNNSDRNWNRLFGEYTTDETAWYGEWNTYSPDRKLIKSKQVIRSFRSNADNTAITHTNRYIGADGNVEETTWQIDRATCNQPDGVSHPAASSMRTLAFEAGALAFLSQKLASGNACGVELFFRDREWRTSIAIIYGENGHLSHITQIREHLESFSAQLLSLESSEFSGDWIGKQRAMTCDLSISPEEEIQLSFDKITDSHQIVSFPSNMIAMFAKSVDVDRPIQLAVGQRTADHQLQYLAAHYAADGAFSRLVSATLHLESV